MSQHLGHGAPGAHQGAARQENNIGLKQAWWALLFVVLYVAAFVGAAMAAGLLDLVDFTSGTSIVVFLAGTTALIILALYLHLIRRNRLRLTDLGFRRPTPRMFHLLWQIPLSILTAGTLQVLFLSALVPLGVDTSAAGSSGGPFADLPALPPGVVILAAVVIAVLTPLWEEMLFRGAFLSGFSRRYKPFTAVVLSAVLFAALHLAILNFVHLFVLGVALALLRRFHQNLWAPILLHAANNALVILIVFTVA